LKVINIKYPQKNYTCKMCQNKTGAVRNSDAVRVIIFIAKSQ
jgi:hypothetical protein